MGGGLGGQDYHVVLQAAGHTGGYDVLGRDVASVSTVSGIYGSLMYSLIL